MDILYVTIDGLQKKRSANFGVDVPRKGDLIEIDDERIGTLVVTKVRRRMQLMEGNLIQVYREVVVEAL